MKEYLDGIRYYISVFRSGIPRFKIIIKNVLFASILSVIVGGIAVGFTNTAYWLTPSEHFQLVRIVWVSSFSLVVVLIYIHFFRVLDRELKKLREGFT